MTEICTFGVLRLALISAYRDSRGAQEGRVEVFWPNWESNKHATQNDSWPIGTFNSVKQRVPSAKLRPCDLKIVSGSMKTESVKCLVSRTMNHVKQRVAKDMSAASELVRA